MRFSGVVALNDVSLNVNRGEIFSLIGAEWLRKIYRIQLHQWI